MAMAALLEWLRSLRNLPEHKDDRYIRLILDGYAARRCDDVLAPSDELGIVPHFIPPGLTDVLRPLDRSVFGALKAKYRAIYRYEMSQREERRMTKADFAAFLILAWDLVSDEAIHRGWEATALTRGLCWHNCRRPLFSDSLTLCRWLGVDA
jgi:hypothetical protein